MAYVNSVQQVSIVFGTGDSSKTATISAVGSNAFIIWQGMQADRNADARVSNIRVTKTNSTTITATRNDTGTNATVNCVIIDADASLVTSVQYGTIAIANPATSGTATITSVDTTKSVALYLGESSTHDFAPYVTNCAFTLTNATTVTAYTDQVRSGHTTTGSFCVVTFASAALAQNVQQFNSAFTTSNATDTQTITSASTSNSIIAFGGTTQAATGDYYHITQSSTTNVNLVRVNTATTSRRPCYAVVTFASGVLASAVQSGLLDLGTGAGFSSLTTTITSISTTVGVVSYVGTKMRNGSLNDNYQLRNTLTNATTITVNRAGNDNNTPEASGWQAFEFSVVTPLTIDRYLRLESISALRNDDNVLLEGITKGQVDRFARFESFTRLTDDNNSGFEFISALRNDDNVLLEAISNVRSSLSLRDESITYLRGDDSNSPLESLTRSTDDNLSQLESISARSISSKMYDETITSLKRDTNAPSEILLKLRVDPSMNFEYWGVFVCNSNVFFESITKAQLDRFMLDESISNQKKDLNVLLEAISRIVIDRNAPSEFLVALKVDSALYTETLMSQVADRLQQLESISRFNSDRMQQLETTGNLSTDKNALFESVLALAAESLQQFESTGNGTFSINPPMQFETTGVTFADAPIRAEFFAQQLLDRMLQIEFMFGSSAASSVEVESLATQSAGGAQRLEFTSSFSTIGAALPLEFVATQLLDAALNTESLSQQTTDTTQQLEFVEGFTVSLGADLPIEFMQTLVAESSQQFEIKMYPSTYGILLHVKRKNRILQPDSKNVILKPKRTPREI